MTQRTPKQQAALEVYCAQMAEALNDAGISKVEFYKRLKSGFESKWTQDSFKDFFRDVMVTMHPQHTSTSQMNSKEIQDVYEVIDYGISQKTNGISRPWPSLESQYYEQTGEVK